ncbi:MAG: head-tail connector protein [Wolbachia endosymbiont of Tyrophagus putrescentiae]|nr:head-tail connector protein [Wolbachia endosymbiont of Tyrophagus putrescentiae]
MSILPIIFTQRKSKSGAFPVTLEEVKTFLRIENNQNDDQLILSLIAMSTDYAEWHMEKSLMKQTWQISCEGHIPRRIYLSYGPVQKIISVTSRNQKLEYYFSSVGSYIESTNTQELNITYEAGYDNVPGQIKQGLIQHVAILYKNRESDISSHLSEIKKVYSPFCNPKVVL